jgi:hypothetical protein
MKKSEFKKMMKDSKKPQQQTKGERVDPIQELRRAYATPQKVAHVGKKGFV